MKGSPENLRKPIWGDCIFSDVSGEYSPLWTGAGSGLGLQAQDQA